SYRHPTSTEPGYFKDMTLAVKKACPKTPVILTGGITTGEQAEALLQEYVADMIGVGRAILQDSDWAKKNM
ncbi:MAG: NADH:flavin oxidoreductase, partial [Clostridia bacterium]|nr:NADH:flavin oxidoreductase [Clostridia bacterium]